MKENLIKEYIAGSRNLKTYLSSFVLFFAGLAFLLTGLSSYFGKNFFPLSDVSSITFYPQGIVMSFYGMAALSLSFYLFFTIFLNLGSGYNEFSKEDQTVRIVRLGFPGKNRQIFLSYKFETIKSIKFFLKEGLNPRANILLILKDKREIPLFPSQNLLSSSELEKKAITLASFLNLSLESSISSFSD